VAAAGFAAGAALEVVSRLENHQVAFDVIVFGFFPGRCGGLVCIHSFILSFF
jgi:hypothetical protein